jgi:DNA polymerase II small subunit/DNA polymerase delta subunit B
MQNVLRGNPQLSNLTSINKISGNQQGISIIGIVSEKEVTKNKNIMFTIEDLTGTIKVLVNQNKEELYNLANEVSLDCILGFKGTGNDKIFLQMK